jgi:hypothetical protein
MKTLLKILFTTAYLSLMFACSKTDKFLGDNPSADLKKAPVTGRVFVVNPNGSDDTQAILDAFASAKAAGRGSVVQLTEGTFKIGFITVRDFNGYFRGAGKGKTIITNLPALPQADIFAGNSVYPALFKFVSGNLTMTNMTIHINDGIAVASPDPVGDLYCILFLSDNSTDSIPAIRHITAAVDNVDFIAGYDGGTAGWSPLTGGPTMYNVWSAIMVTMDNQWAGLMPNGDISVTNSKMENFVFGTWIWSLNFGSSAKIENNLFTGGGFQTLMAGVFGSEIKIRNNHYQKGTLCDLYIDNWNWFATGPDLIVTKQTQFTITGNDFHSPEGVTSLTMNDSRRPIYPDQGFPMLCNVTGNSFNTRDEGMAILSLCNVDAKILNNKFSGTGAVGVVIDGVVGSTTGYFPTFTTYAENNSLMANNFFTANYQGANVYLGTLSRNCKVEGVSSDKVVDDGVNNRLIGVNPHKGFVNPVQRHYNNFSTIPEKLLRIVKH